MTEISVKVPFNRPLKVVPEVSPKSSSKIILLAVLDTHCHRCCRPLLDSYGASSNSTQALIRERSKNTRDFTEGNAVITRHALTRDRTYLYVKGYGSKVS